MRILVTVSCLSPLALTAESSRWKKSRPSAATDLPHQSAGGSRSANAAAGLSCAHWSSLDSPEVSCSLHTLVATAAMRRGTRPTSSAAGSSASQLRSTATELAMLGSTASRRKASARSSRLLSEKSSVICR
uniref:Secreted protein n=1 Tax=Zea mays TaxID=4577 RepID=C4J6B9_MAIZE|nr:unknown [Zea mays]